MWLFHDQVCRSSSSDSTAKSELQLNDATEPSSPFALPLDLPRLPWQRKPDLKKIVVNDLDATIKAHQDANRIPIRKVKTTTSNVQLNGAKRPITQLERYKNLDSADEMGNDLVGQWSMKSLWKDWDDFSSIEKSSMPWVRFLEPHFEIDSMRRLHDEIKAFCAYMEPRQSEASATQACISGIKKIVAEKTPSVQLQLHGSRATGIAGPLSDVDFFVASNEPQAPDEPKPRFHTLMTRTKGIKHMNALKAVLQNNARFKDVELLASKILTLRATDVPTGLAIQFITNVPAPVLHAREFTIYYLAEFPQLRLLYTVIRHALHTRGLTTVFNGGIGSYPLLIMIVTALTHSKKGFGRTQLAHQLLHVLKFWANADIFNYGFAADPPLKFPKFKFRKNETSFDDGYAVGIEAITRKNRALHGRMYLKRREKPYGVRWDEFKYKLCLQDPANPVNDLGEKTTAMRKIRQVFCHLYERIRTKRYAWEKRSPEERQAAKRTTIVHLITPLVKARYDDFVKARYQLRQADPDWYGMNYASRERPTWDPAKLTQRLNTDQDVSDKKTEGREQGVHENPTERESDEEEEQEWLTNLGRMIEKSKANANEMEAV